MIQINISCKTMDRTMDRFFFYRSPKRRRRWVYLQGAESCHRQLCPWKDPGSPLQKERGLEKAVSTWTPESQRPTAQCSRQDQCSHFSSISGANYGFCGFSFPICLWTQQEQTSRNYTELFKDWCTLPSTDRREDRSRYTGASLKLQRCVFSEGRLTHLKLTEHCLLWSV